MASGTLGTCAGLLGGGAGAGARAGSAGGGRDACAAGAREPKGAIGRPEGFAGLTEAPGTGPDAARSASAGRAAAAGAEDGAGAVSGKEGERGGRSGSEPTAGPAGGGLEAAPVELGGGFERIAIIASAEARRAVLGEAAATPGGRDSGVLGAGGATEEGAAATWGATEGIARRVESRSSLEHAAQVCAPSGLYRSQCPQTMPISVRSALNVNPSRPRDRHARRGAPRPSS